MSYQEKIYLEAEANDFFLRNINDINIGELGLRPSKEAIYRNIENYYGSGFHGLDVMEVGCFIGDLLNMLRNSHACNIVGIEPSSKACDYAIESYGISLINNTFNACPYFGFDENKLHSLDLIIADDVLSWMSRQLILPVLASFDWLLRPGGIIYLRDFCPPMDFAYPNHHQPGKDVFNYKVAGGHKKFFLETGNYLIAQEFVRSDSAFQKAATRRVDSTIWSDSLLLKSALPLQPRLAM